MVLGAQLENFTIDQFAGALALTLGSIGGLLMIVWKSRCHCKFNLCWLCQCERKPPPDGDDSDAEETPQDTPTTPTQAPTAPAPALGAAAVLNEEEP